MVRCRGYRLLATRGMAMALVLAACSPLLIKRSYRPLLAARLRWPGSRHTLLAASPGSLARVAAGVPLLPGELGQRAAYPLGQVTDWGQAQPETLARASYNRAQQLATQAAGMQVGRGHRQVMLQRQAFLWRAAIAQLQTIPPTSPLAPLASQQQHLYQQRLAVVIAHLREIEADALKQIAGKLGAAEGVRISVCHLAGACRHYQGQLPPASPASLIKVPIALVLLQQVATTAKDLGDRIYIAPHNFTETMAPARISVGRHYSLGQVMARMIDESNNIATNQLIDYLGWSTLNHELQRQGFATIRVRTKLVGAHTYPSHNRGWAANILTTAELTTLMRSVYAQRLPGAGHLIRALATQTHHDFGYQALRAFPSQRVAWLGEKTGQNSRVIGSTLAVRIDGEIYVLTVTLDHSGNHHRLRQIIQDVVGYLLYQDGLREAPLPLAQGS